MIDEKKIKEVWEKAVSPNESLKDQERYDPCGAKIHWDKYGDRESDYGWEIDHVVPKAMLMQAGASEEEIDNISNLRAMHWENNDSKATDYPEYKSQTTFEGGKNIQKEAVFSVNSSLQNILKALYNKYGV